MNASRLLLELTSLCVEVPAGAGRRAFGGSALRGDIVKISVDFKEKREYAE